MNFINFMKFIKKKPGITNSIVQRVRENMGKYWIQLSLSYQLFVILFTR